MRQERRLEGQYADLNRGELAFHSVPQDRVDGHAADFQGSGLVVGVGGGSDARAVGMLAQPGCVAALGRLRRQKARSSA